MLNTGSQQYVTLTIKTCIPVENVPNIVNDENTELLSMELGNNIAGHTYTGPTTYRRNATVPATTTARMAATTSTKKPPLFTPKRSGTFTSALLELFMSAPNRDFTKEELHILFKLRLNRLESEASF